MIEISLTVEQAQEMERHVSQHMELCYDYLGWSELADQEEEMPDFFEPVSMFCGCETCESRERFMATFDYLRNANIVDIAVE